MTLSQPCEPVGALEVAARLGVRRETVAQWKQRGLMPPPRWTVGGDDAWDWNEDIRPWAEKTHRWPPAQGEGEVTSTTAAQITITITRKDTYRADGSHRHFVYSYTPSEPLSLNGRHTYPAGVAVEYGTSLTELRAMLRRKVPGVKITEAWK